MSPIPEGTRLHFVTVEEGHYDIIIETPEGVEDVELACTHDKEWGEWLVKSAAEFHGLPVEIE